jgi:hypothetical protein
LVAAMSGRCTVAAILMIMAGSALIIKEGGQAILGADPGLPIVALWKDTTTPILFETANDFLQAYYYYPDRRAQFWYTAQPEMARKLQRDDLEDINLRALAARQPMHITTLENFLRETPAFVLIPKASYQRVGWVAQCLFSAGADMKIATMAEGSLARSGGTIFWQPTYLFKVTVSPDSARSINGCQNSK